MLLLASEGVLSLKERYLDGTKIEANANRYTFVWGKRIQYNKDRIKQQLKALRAYVAQVYKEETQHPNEPDFDQTDPEKVSRTITKINVALQGKPVDKKIRQKLNYAKKHWPGNLER